MSSTSGRRITRAASRASSVDPAPSEAGSDRSTRSSSRIPEGTSKSRRKSTRLYGTTGEPGSAKQDSQEVEKPAIRIQRDIVEPAQAGGTGTVLPTIEEEAQGGNREGSAGGNVSGISSGPKVSQLTTKTYGQETVISTNFNDEMRRSIERWNSSSTSAFALGDHGNNLDDYEKTLSVPNVLKTLFYMLLWFAFAFSLAMPFWIWWRLPGLNTLIYSDFGKTIPAKLSTIFDRLDVMDHALVIHKLDISDIRSKVDRNMDTNILEISNIESKVEKNSQEISNLEIKIQRLEGRIPRINYFSFDLGARVDEFLTSPRLVLDAPVKKRLKWLFPNYWRGKPFMKPQFASRDSSQALKGWSEALDRWCAASNRGRLQLVIKMPRAIAPETLVVEHFPRNELLMYGAAPKELELWLRITDDAMRFKILELVLRACPEFIAREASYRERKLEEKGPLDDTWIPVGLFVFNTAYTTEYSQSFPIPVDLVRYGVATNEAAIRVNSNWGNLDSTCLYRVILHGHYNSGPDEVLGTDF